MSRDRTSFAPNHTNSRVIGAHADPGGAGYTPGSLAPHERRRNPAILPVYDTTQTGMIARNKSAVPPVDYAASIRRDLIERTEGAPDRLFALVCVITAVVAVLVGVALGVLDGRP